MMVGKNRSLTFYRRLNVLIEGGSSERRPICMSRVNAIILLLSGSTVTRIRVMKFERTTFTLRPSLHCIGLLFEFVG